MDKQSTDVFGKIYFVSGHDEMEKLIEKYNWSYLDLVCKAHNEKKSILHYLATNWFYALLEEGCKQLPDSINWESRLDETPLSNCFFPKGIVVKQLKINKNLLDSGKRCIEVLMRYGADINRTSFRHLSKPFEMGQICIDPVLRECLLPPQFNLIILSSEEPPLDEIPPPPYE